MSATLASMESGFADPVHDAQQTFRVLLGAMAEPGRLFTLGPAATNGLQPSDPALRPPLSPALAAALLTLADADTPVHLSGSLATDEARAWLRFHIGARDPGKAAGLTATRARDLDRALCRQLDLGTDDAPQSSATLLLEVDALSDAPLPGAVALNLRGPGIASARNVAVAGLTAEFWRWRTTLQAHLPRGIDLVLVCDTQVVAIPRSTRIESES